MKKSLLLAVVVLGVAIHGGHGSFMQSEVSQDSKVEQTNASEFQQMHQEEQVYVLSQLRSAGDFIRPQ